MISRSDWLEWRRAGLGGTDVSAIRGEHPWRSPWDVWMSKVHGVDGPDRPEFAIGRWLEQPIAEWAAGDLGLPLVNVGAVVGPESWMRASPDFLLANPDGRRTILEIKTDLFPGEKWGPAPDGAIPPQYDDQVQWYMLCLAGTGPVRADVAVVAVYLKGSNERRLYTVEANPERQAALRDFGREWWQRHIVDGEPPPSDYSSGCRDGLARLHPEHSGVLRPATDAEEEAARVLADLQERVAELTDSREELRNWLRSRIGDDEGLRFHGGRVRWSRPSNRLTVRIR